MAGQYQSKVFNLLSRYSMKLRDQSAQTWRQARVAAIWSLQIVLYPVYVAYQSGRLVGKQLRQTTRQTVPRLRAATKRLLSAEPHLLPESDAPIQQTLELTRLLDVHLPDHQPVMLLTEFDAPNAERELAQVMQQQVDRAENLHQPAEAALDVAAVRIRGVASDRATQKLVLVTTRNQILDILTPEQSDHLSRRIVAATALYWRQQRQLCPPETDRWLVSTYLPSVRVQNNALPPIRLFQSLMAWMQHSALAQSANLFQESRLPALPPSMASLNGLDESLQPMLRYAQSGWIAAETRWQDWWQQSQRQISRQIDQRWGNLLGYGSFWSVSNSPPIDITAVPGSPAESKSWLEQIDLWLSKIPGLRAQPLLPPQGQWPSPQFADSVPEHLPTYPVAPQWPPTQPMSPAFSQRSAQVWETVDTSALEQVIKPAVVRQQPRESARQPQGPKSSRRTALTPPPLRKLDAIDLEHAEAPLSSLDTANLEEAAMMPQSWIETEAQLVRYEKHPLTQLLEWLDQGMLWIEDRVTQFWSWVTRLAR